MEIKKRKRCSLTSTDRLLQILNGLLLAGVVVALLVVEPSELLKDLGMVGVAFQNAPVGNLSGFKLGWGISIME